MTILGLDLGTHTGWAIYREGKITASGTHEFKLKRGDSPGMRYGRFSGWLNGLIIEKIYGFGDAEFVVAYEQPHQRGGAATEILYGFVAHLQRIVASFEYPHGEHTAVHTGTLKKFITGSGRASKEDVIRVVNKWVDRDITDDNEADAIAVALWAAQSLGEKPDVD